MGGVDKKDQVNTYYNHRRKVYRGWQKRIYHHFFVTAVTNAHILYNQGLPKNRQLKLLQFMEAVFFWNGQGTIWLQ